MLSRLLMRRAMRIIARCFGLACRTGAESSIEESIQVHWVEAWQGVRKYGF